METPRTPRPAQPEIEFLGRPDAPRSHHVSDLTVRDAFVAFHRNTGSGVRIEPASGFISRGGLALTALTLLAFGGGLSLAVFSFNSPEKSGGATVARAPEIIYKAPATVEMPSEPEIAPVYDVTDELGLFATSALELRAMDQPIPETSVWRDMSAANFSPFSGSYAGGGAPTFAGAGEQSFASQPLANVDGTAGDVTAGFGALTAAPVPEPSTWATMVSGAALLFVFGKLKRRRN